MTIREAETGARDGPDPGSRRGIEPAVAVVLVLGVGTLLYALGLGGMSSDRAVPMLWRLPLLVVLACAELFRRRRPVVALAIGSVAFVADFLLYPSIPVWLVYSDLLYVAVAYGRRRFSRAVTIGAITACPLIGVIAALEGGGDVRVGVFATALAALVFGNAVVWGTSVRSYRIVAEAERARAEDLAVIAELDRRAAVADERNAMARDLHDVIAGHLSAIALAASAAAELASVRDDPTAARVLASIRGSGVSALTDMRAMIDLLRSAQTDDPIAPAGLAETDRVVASARSSGTEVVVRRDIDPSTLPTVVDHTLFRILSESVTNAVRHAPGVPVTADLAPCDGGVRLTVRNSLVRGVGHPPALGTRHHGTAIMRERAELVGGRATVGARGEDWIVDVRVPIPSGDAGVGSADTTGNDTTGNDTTGHGGRR